MKENYTKMILYIFFVVSIRTEESEEDILVEYNCPAEYRDDIMYE